MTLSQRSQILCCSLWFSQAFSDQHRHYWRHPTAKKEKLTAKSRKWTLPIGFTVTLQIHLWPAWYHVICLWFCKGEGVQRRGYVCHTPAFALYQGFFLELFFSNTDGLWVLLTPHRDVCFLPLKLQVGDLWAPANYSSPQTKTVRIES